MPNRLTSVTGHKSRSRPVIPNPSARFLSHRVLAVVVALFLVAIFAIVFLPGCGPFLNAGGKAALNELARAVGSPAAKRNFLSDNSASNTVTQVDSMAASPTPGRNSGLPIIFPTPNLFIPTPQPLPTLLPTQRLPASSNLMFLADKKLTLWSYPAQKLGVLTEQVIDYSLNPAASRLAILRANQEPGSSVQTYDLVRMDLPSRQEYRLLRGVPYLFGLAISPDGRWVVYSAQQKNAGLSEQVAGNTQPTAEAETPQPEGEAASGAIYAVRTDGSGDPVKLGDCQALADEKCAPFFWSPDSQMVLWRDHRGVWFYDFPTSTYTLALPEQIQIVDPKGGKSKVQIDVEIKGWSPRGRFVLLKVAVVSSDVRWLGLLDTRNGRLAPVPDTYALQTDLGDGGWMSDGSVFVTLGGDLQRTTPAQVKVWKVFSTQTSLLKLDRQVAVEMKDFPARPASFDNNQTYTPIWSARLSDRMIGFGVTVPGANLLPVLFTLDMKNGLVQKIGEAPEGTTQLLWEPNRRGLLVLGQPGQAELINALTGDALDLQPVFGSDAAHFTWLAADYLPAR